jgi:putative hemolysin
MRVVLDLSLVFLLAALSVALSTLEAAFFLIKRRRLGHMARPNPRVELANEYLADPPRLLMPLQIGTYTAHVGMTVLLTSLVLDWLGHGAILVALTVMTAYLFLFGLTLPYAIVRRNPERVLLLLLPAFHRYVLALAPIVGTLRRRATFEGAAPATPTENGAQEAARPAGDEPTTTEDNRLSAAVERFSNLVVRNIMTPRADMLAIPSTLTVREVRRILGETKFSRVPVYRGNLDDIVGLIGVRDLVQCDAAADDGIETLIRPVRLVPETKRVADLLRDLQGQQATMAVVIDEYGGTAGLVSMEDIVEELVGEIKDEYDSETEPITREEDGVFVVGGRVPVDRVEEALGTRLCVEEDVGTVGGLVVKVFGRIPRPGESGEHAGFYVQVLEADRRRVKRVRFRRKPPEDLT